MYLKCSMAGDAVLPSGRRCVYEVPNINLINEINKLEDIGSKEEIVERNEGDEKA